MLSLSTLQLLLCKIPYVDWFNAAPADVLAPNGARIKAGIILTMKTFISFAIFVTDDFQNVFVDRITRFKVQTWYVHGNISALDIVSETAEVLQLLPRDEQAYTLLVLSLKPRSAGFFVLYQLKNGDVFAKFEQTVIGCEYKLQRIYIKYHSWHGHKIN